MNKKTMLMLLVVLTYIIAGCSSREEVGRIKLHRLDLALNDYEHAGSIEKDSILAEYGDVLVSWGGILGLSQSDDSLINKCAKSRAIEVFTPDVIARFDDIDSIEKVLFKLENNISKILNFSDNREYYAVVSPYTQSIYMSDSLMFVALNHYLGKDYPGYGYFENYQRITKTPKHLPYDIAEAIVKSKYPYQYRDGNTVLNVLLYNGAIMAAIMNIVPDAEEAEALGYSIDQLLWLDENEKEAWNALIGRRLLYSTSMIDADRLVKPSPSTSILHQQCPGRAGRYIGYQIVKSFLENNKEMSVSQLLSPSFYNDNQSLIKSKYNGE